MMRIVRRVCGVPVGLPAALWMLETGAWVLRTETELLIKSRNVVPGRLLASGFEFHFTEMEKAVREIEGRFSRKGSVHGFVTTVNTDEHG
jgi:NAD dependent epimerase/dehydratase family enzyme